MQPGEWRTTQGIERPPTFATAIPLQTIRMTVPTHALRSAMRTRRSGSAASFDDRRRSRARLQYRHLDSNSLQLARRQLPEQGNDSVHVRRAHFGLLDKSAHRRHATQYPLRQAHYVSHSTDFANRAKKKPALPSPHRPATHPRSAPSNCSMRGMWSNRKSPRWQPGMLRKKY